MDFNEYQKQASTVAVYPGSDIAETRSDFSHIMSILQDYYNRTPSSKASKLPTLNRLAKSLENYKNMGHVYTALGLAGESGEHAEKVKKLLRDSHGHMTAEMKETRILELGDVLWYISEAARQLGVDFETIAEKNLEKLFSRKDRGTLQGSGDNR